MKTAVTRYRQPQEESGIQLELNFQGEKGNRFKEKLNTGSFQVFLQVTPPAREVPEEELRERFGPIEYLAGASKLQAALAITDNLNPGAMDAITFASAVCPVEHDKHLLFLSGRNRNMADMEKFASHAILEGFRNMVIVSGAPGMNDTGKTLGRTPFCESVPALEFLSRKYSAELFAGATVNPYSYTPETSWSHLAKCTKKIRCGASFLVTTAGWDLLKLQELRCQLMRRGEEVPVIAQLMVLTPELAEEIASGMHKGLTLSPDMRELFRREAKHSRAQFEAAQLRHIALHAAGARVLGCSGILLSALDSPPRIQAVLHCIEEALEEFPTFEVWQKACQEFYDRLCMAPYPRNFYAFEDLLAKSYTAELPRIRNCPIAPLTSAERFRFNWAKCLLSDADSQPAREKLLTKKLLASCARGSSCRNCLLPRTDYICLEQCPKRMMNGPCSQLLVDGKCPFLGKECVHVARVRYAEFLDHFSSLEEEILPQNMEEE